MAGKQPAKAGKPKASETIRPKAEAFALEYIKDLNGTQAAIRAGYSQRGADVQAVRLLANASVQKRIAELKDERNRIAKIDATYVLNRLKEIDQMDVLDVLTDSGELKPIKDWPKVWRTTLSGLDVMEISSGENGPAALLKKIKWPDKVKNLELLGKHVDVQAFKEQVKAEHDVTGSLADLMDELSGNGDS